MIIPILMVFWVGNASAFDNPDEDDIFWDMVGSMSTPNDVTSCKATVDELAASGELWAYDVENRREQGQDVSGESWSGDPAQITSLTSGYYNTCEMFADGFQIMRNSMEQYGKTSNIWDMPDWRTVSGLYFLSSGEGKIYFTETLNFMSYRFQEFLANFSNLVTMQNGYISLNAAMVPELQNYGAVLTMYNLSFTETPDIYVDGVKADTSNMGVSYDAAAGTLTFTAPHFSSYQAVAKGSSQSTMKISKTSKKSIKYKPKKNRFKIKVKGRGLKKQGQTTVCKLGFNDAIKVSPSKKGKSVVCTFRMSDFSQKGYYPLTVSVPGGGEVTRANAIRIR